jgi:hypothetical protein
MQVELSDARFMLNMDVVGQVCTKLNWTVRIGHEVSRSKCFALSRAPWVKVSGIPSIVCRRMMEAGGRFGRRLVDGVFLFLVFFSSGRTATVLSC